MNDVKARFRSHLRPGEELRWVGKPDPNVIFSPADKFLIPFSLIWGGFAIFWEVTVLTGDGPTFFALWGIPFVLIGLYFIFGRFIYKRLVKRRTVYGLTDSRALVSTTERSVRGIPLAGISINSDRSRDGRHITVLFGETRHTAYQNTGMDLHGSSGGRGIGFFDVDLQRPSGGQGIGFFDVEQPDSLARALTEVRSGTQRD